MSCFVESSISTVDWRVASSKGERNDVSGASQWRGDHTFSSSAAGFSLRNFIEPEIEMRNPSLSKKKVQQLALDTFELRLRQDLSFEHQETNHIDTTVHWKIVDGINGKKELATAYGAEFITLSQLWDHTRAYATHTGNPNAYNREEERAQISMQDAFINGNATGFVTVISHPDAIRFVQVWEKTTTGDVLSKQIDLYATTGRDFTHIEGEELVERISKFHETIGASAKQEDISYTHVLLTSGAITVDDIRTIAVAHAYTNMPHDVPMHTDMVAGIAKKMQQDISEAVAVLGMDFHMYIQKRIDDMEEKFIKKREVQKVSLPDAVPMVIKKSQAVSMVSEGVTTQTKKSVEDVFSEWVFGHTVISYALLHQVFALSAIEIFVLEPFPTAIFVHPYLPYGRALGNPEERGITIRDKQPERVVEVFDRMRVSKKEVFDVSLTVESVVLFLHTIFGETENKEQTRVDYIHNIEDKILFIIHALSFLAIESGNAQPTLYRNKVAGLSKFERDLIKQDYVERKMHKTESGVLFGMIIWMILQGFDQVSVQSDTRAPLEREEYFSTTTWVLFSIIWYLSMLREVGMRQSTNSMVVMNQKQKKPTHFPLFGVIYIYIHDRISP